MEELNIPSLYRVLVLGSPGSGKSTLAKKLSDILHIPCYHLDDIYWLSDWKRSDESIHKENVNVLLKKPEWIIDGNYYRNLSQRLEQSNFIIYLDCPIWLCFYRALYRAFTRRFKDKSSLPKSIREDKEYRPKLKVNFRFARLIVLFKMKYKHKILSLINSYHLNYVRLRSSTDYQLLLNHIKKHSDDKNSRQTLCAQ